MKVNIKDEGPHTYYEIDLTEDELRRIKKGIYPLYAIKDGDKEHIFSVGLDLFQ